ncbi:MAG: ribosome biogenesis GTPase Der [Cyanobacteria bacterium P01_H01_bin.74]
MKYKQSVVAVVGRPNVGKSTFVNRIIGARSAIVDDTPGVTRDRSYHEVSWQGHTFTLIDTGGIMPEPDLETHPFAELINLQVDIAVTEADLIVFLVDGHDGVTPVDETIAQALRQSNKPVLLAVNKIDNPAQQHNSAEFFSLSLGTPYSLSALHGNIGVGDLLDEVLKSLPAADTEPDEDGGIKIALVGRPNVGKSSLLNAMLGEDRAIVSDISGTTRDAIQAPLVVDDQLFWLVDTAGIRKKGKVGYGIEQFSVDRSLRAIRSADVTVMVLDATENESNTLGNMVTDQDKKIIETSNAAGKALVILINKWDLIANKTPSSSDQLKKRLLLELPHASFAAFVFTSAVKKQRITAVFNWVKTVYDNASRRIKTSLINEVLSEAFVLSPPPPIKNKRLKLLYATQVSSNPPTFILFVNDAKLFKDNYKRYLDRKLRESFEFFGTPLVIAARSRDEKKPSKPKRSTVKPGK